MRAAHCQTGLPGDTYRAIAGRSASIARTCRWPWASAAAGSARPEWGRETDISFAQALEAGKVPKLRDIQEGFSDPRLWSLLYHVSSLVVEHLIDTYGNEAWWRLLRAYGKGLETDAAFALPDVAIASLALVGPKDGRGLRFVAIASGAAVGGAYVWWRKDWPNGWGPKPTALLPASAVASASIVLYKFVNAKRPLR